MLAIFTPTTDYTVHQATCPLCLTTWSETTHELWNVVAVTCPNCHHVLAVGLDDFHGDSNYTPIEEIGA